MTNARRRRSTDAPSGVPPYDWTPPVGYEVVRLLGSGGMGEVFLVHDRQGRPVAIKVMHAALAQDTAFRIRFTREVAAARRVRGPWTAEVLAADPDAPRPWLATEYVDGPSLAGAVDGSGPLPEATVRALGTRLARALTAIHGAGLVHRDLTPANVLLAPDGPRVVDFGVARALDGTKLTLTGEAVGTPAYMAPEQLGDTAAGPSADVFTLGSLLCFAATGRGPFDDASTVATLRRVLTGDADIAAVPPRLREVVARCLQVSPAARPTTQDLVAALGDDEPGADEALSPLATAVQTHRARTAVATAPAGAARRPGPVTPRRAVLAGALALVALVVAGVVASTVGEPAATPVATGPVIPAQWAPAPTSPPPVTAEPSTVVPESVAYAAPVVPGWIAALSPDRDVAYDVPPTWSARSPGAVEGVGDGRGISRMTGIAEFGSGFCAGRPGRARAYAGVFGSPTGRPADAARDVARLWAGRFSAADDDRAARVRDMTSAPLTVRGVSGVRVTATVDAPVEDPCDPPRGVVHTVALPATGGTVVWVLVADQDVAQVPAQADIDGMIATIRPAGQGCRAGSAEPGRWC